MGVTMAAVRAVATVEAARGRGIRGTLDSDNASRIAQSRWSTTRSMPHSRYPTGKDLCRVQEAATGVEEEAARVAQAA